MTAPAYRLVPEVGRVPSMSVPLDRAQETRLARLMEDLILIDLHEHPVVLPERLDDFQDYLAAGPYQWGYGAVRHGGWTAVGTANVFRAAARAPEMSFIAFHDLITEIGEMLVDVAQHQDVAMVVRSADDILRARQDGKTGFLPTVEHLGIGYDLGRLDILYALGVRLGGLTYAKRNYIGDGLNERTDSGLSELGLAVVERMNELGMVIDLSHAGMATAIDAIGHSRVPVVFSHNAAHTLRPTRRTRKDAELVACAEKGGVVAVTAVPNSLSDDPNQDIACVLDHYDYLVNLVGVDHVAIGTDTLIGDHVGYHLAMMRGDAPAAGRRPPAPYLNGLESPADGKNIVRGLIARGYGDADIRKIAGENALRLFREVLRG